MSAPHYALYYFPLRGRAEPIRLLLHLAGQAFEDHRIAGPDWAALKPESPLGQMPFLVESDASGTRRIPQSLSILRHLARRYDLYGKDAAAALACDVLVDTCSDLRTSLSPLQFGASAKDPELRARYGQETLPTHLRRLARLHAQGPGGFFVGEGPTWADLLAFDSLEAVLALFPEALADQPELAGFVARVRALPALLAYLAERAAAGR